MASPSKAHNADSLSLATRYSLLRGRHLSMEKYWNERHCNDKKYIQQLEQRNAALLEMLQLAQNEINVLKQRAPKKAMTKINEEEEEEDDDDPVAIATNSIAHKAQLQQIEKSLNLQHEYKKLLKHKISRSQQRENLFYEVLRECLFLSDPYNIRILLKRSKTSKHHTKEAANGKNEQHSDGQLPLQSSLSTILKLRKQIDYECDCFSIYCTPSSSYSTRLILMRNSLIICGVGLSSKYCADKAALCTLPNISVELYTIAGIYICNNDPYSYCNSMIIACSKDLTVAAHGVNPLDNDNNNVIRYRFNIFSDSKKLIHSLTERLPDYVWHINTNQNNESIDSYDKTSTMYNDTKHEASSSMVGRLGAGLYAGITGVVMDPIRGGQNDGMKGFLRGIASGISGVAIKPITHFRSNSNASAAAANMLSPAIKSEEKEKDGAMNIRGALHIPDSPLVFQAESMSESESITSSTITTNTLDSSRSEQSTNLNPHQSQIFDKHKLIQRQQYLSTINTKTKPQNNHNKTSTAK